MDFGCLGVCKLPEHESCRGKLRGMLSVTIQGKHICMCICLVLFVLYVQVIIGASLSKPTLVNQRYKCHVHKSSYKTDYLYKHCMFAYQIT